MVEAGRVYCQTSKSFVNGLRELGHQCSGDNMMEVSGSTSHGGVIFIFLLGLPKESALLNVIKLLILIFWAYLPNFPYRILV